MKYLLLTLEYPPFFGGVANFYGNLVAHWPDPAGIMFLNNAGNRLLSDKLPALKWLPSVIELYRTAKGEGVGHILVGQILPLGIAALINKKLAGTPYSVVIHGMDFTYALKKFRKKKVAACILHNADHIICGNSYVAGLVEKFLGKRAEGKVAVVNPGVELDLENKASEYELRKKHHLENKLILLSIGRLVKRKGFDMAIDSFQEAVRRIPDLVYFILGTGPELENWKSKIKDSGLEDKIMILSGVTDEEKSAWLKTSDIFIMPAREIDGDFEGFGIVYLEANLAGKPVIAGRSGGVADAVIDGVNGLMVDPEDKNDITNAIIRLAQDRSLSAKLGEQGRERAIKYGWKDQTEKFFNILEKK